MLQLLSAGRIRRIEPDSATEESAAFRAASAGSELSLQTDPRSFDSFRSMREYLANALRLIVLVSKPHSVESILLNSLHVIFDLVGGFPGSIHI
jgi:hypothetical protein